VTSEMSWRKSSYSGGSGGNCVEVADHDRHVMVRDAKQKAAGPTLRFTPAAWRRFAEQVKQSLADPTGSADTCRGRSRAWGRSLCYVWPGWFPGSSSGLSRPSTSMLIHVEDERNDWQNNNTHGARPAY
jgi:hypothetical protein